jgi:phenylacetate-CoA ligase
MSSAERATESTLAALRGLVSELLSAPNNFYAPRLKGGGIDDAAGLSIESFVRDCPFTTKDDIAADRLGSPFGTNLTRPIAEYPRLCQTSGTTGAPVAWPDSDENWAAMLDAWEVIYRSAGIEPGRDRIYFAFSFGPFLGFWTAFEAAARMGCMAVPGGGVGSAARLAAIDQLGATVLCCTPTYAMRLGSEKSGALKIEKIIVAGEPGGSVAAVRQQISALWDGARVIDHHGMTEVGPVSMEAPGAAGNLCLIPGYHFAEIIDIETGKEVPDGGEGELVLTTLRRPDSPALRYRTGDLVKKAWYEVGGERVLGFEGGILGRIDDMVVVRGVNIYPSAVDAVLRRFDEIEEYQVVETSERAMAEISVRIEVTDGAAVGFEDRVGEALASAFTLRIPVEIVSPRSLPRFEFKAKRWVKA